MQQSIGSVIKTVGFKNHLVINGGISLESSENIIIGYFIWLSA